GTTSDSPFPAPEWAQPFYRDRRQRWPRSHPCRSQRALPRGRCNSRSPREWERDRPSNDPSEESASETVRSPVDGGGRVDRPASIARDTAPWSICRRRTVAPDASLPVTFGDYSERWPEYVPQCRLRHSGRSPLASGQSHRDSSSGSEGSSPRRRKFSSRGDSCCETGSADPWVRQTNTTHASHQSPSTGHTGAFRCSVFLRLPPRTPG